MLLVGLVPLTACQSMGDHFSCMAEVDRTVPAQTQQRYIRTDTKCVRSNEQSLGGGMGTIYNPAQGDINCSAIPIYETIVLNQAQRDAAYQQCRNRVGNQRTLSQSSGTYQYPNPSVNYQPPPSYGGQKMTIDQAMNQCNLDGLKKGTAAYGDCIRKYSQQ